MIAQNLFQTPTYGNMAFAAQLDRFEWSDYLVSYVYNAASDDSASDEIKANMERYAQRLEQVDSNIIPYYLAESYFNLGRTEDAFRMLEKYVTYVSSDPQTWEDAFLLIMSKCGGERHVPDRGCPNLPASGGVERGKYGDHRAQFHHYDIY